MEQPEYHVLEIDAPIARTWSVGHERDRALCGALGTEAGHGQGSRSSSEWSRPNMSGRPCNTLRTSSWRRARAGLVVAWTPARRRRISQRLSPSQPLIMNTNQLGPDGGSAPPPAT